MLFRSNIRETPLTQAILLEDFQTLEQLGKYRDQVLAENELKFNAMELAEYLGKTECLKYLHSVPPPKFKIIPADGHLKELDEKEFEKFFNVKYLNRFKFADYFFFQKVLRSCSWVFKSELFAEEPLEWGKNIRKGQLEVPSPM